MFKHNHLWTYTSYVACVYKECNLVFQWFCSLMNTMLTAAWFYNDRLVHLTCISSAFSLTQPATLTQLKHCTDKTCTTTLLCNAPLHRSHIQQHTPRMTLLLQCTRFGRDVTVASRCRLSGKPPSAAPLFSLLLPSQPLSSPTLEEHVKTAFDRLTDTRLVSVREKRNIYRVLTM